jgi:single-stranded DNA-binding protein
MSYDQNRFQIIGNIAKITAFEEVTKIRIASHIPVKGKDGWTEKELFTTVTVFAPHNRKYIADYVEVGDKVGCDGTIQEGNYAKDGETKYTTDLVTANLGIIAKKKADKADKAKSKGK